MVERISHGMRYRSGEGAELFPIACVARAILLGNAIPAHRPPFVMVAREPDLREVCEGVVFSDLPRREMAMVIKDRLRLGVLVIELACHVGKEEEIFRQKCLHGIGGWRFSAAQFNARMTSKSSLRENFNGSGPQ